MTFTYVGDLSTDLDKVRFHIQDTVSGSGPKPSDGNFTDEELGGLITVEGAWQRATAGAAEILASAWATYTDLKVGPRSEALSKIADSWREQAETWRDTYGSTSGGAGSRHPTKIDGYSDDIAANAV